MASRIAKTETGIGRKAKIWNDNGHFAVQLHSTVVYDETAESITLNNGGWITPTTVRYMNQALAHRGFQEGAVIRKGEMFLMSGTGDLMPFENNRIVIQKYVKCCEKAGRPHTHDGTEVA